jgi:general secretion pathway protein I
MILSSNKGFSLLEAIVAITMIATFGLAIFSWINGLLISVTKIERNYAQDSISRNAVEYLSDINIMEHPNGKVELGRYNMTWIATPIEPIKAGKSTSGTPNDFTLGLYSTQVEIAENGLQPIKIELRLVGYKGEIRSPFE